MTIMEYPYDGVDKYFTTFIWRQNQYDHIILKAIVVIVENVGNFYFVTQTSVDLIW